MVKCVIIDDEQRGVNILKRYVKRTPYLDLVGATTSPVEGIDMINRLDADLVFLDVEMQELNGLKVVQALKPSVKVIFCTAHSQFAVDGFDLNIVDFLLKPVPYDRFQKGAWKGADLILNRAIDALAEPSVKDDYYFVKSELKGKMVKVSFAKVYYIEGASNYQTIHLVDDKILVNKSMNWLEQKFGNAFIRVHKSFIVRVDSITTIQGNTLELGAIGKSIPIGDTYKDAVMERLRGRMLD